MADQVTRAAVAADFNGVRSAAAEAAVLLRRADQLFGAASMFDHERRVALVTLHRSVGEECRRWWLILVGSDQLDSGSGGAIDLGAMVVDVRSSGEHAEDRWLAALGVPRGQLVDPRGIVTVPLLVGAFHGRFEVLFSMVGRLFEPLDIKGLGPFKMLSYARVLLDGFDPIESVQAALQVRELLVQQFTSEPDHTVDVMRAMLEGVDRSYSNMKMILDDRRRIGEATDLEMRARVRLDMYRRMAEGQIRPWSWTLICLHTGATGPVPTLSQLGDRLSASGSDLAAAFADCLVVGSRNDAAHEDVWWDARRRALVGTAGDIDLNLLEELTDRGHGLMGGAEIGWALACVDRPDMAVMTRSRVRIEPPMILQMDPALTRFATNDLRVDAWTIDLDCLTVTVRELTLDTINPCAQAVLEMSLYLDEIDRFEVRVSGRRGAIVVATRRTLRAVLPLWIAAREQFRKMPPAVFLPVLAESRLQIESPPVAARAATWLALNEAIICLDEIPAAPRVVDSSVAEILRQQAQGLRLVASALLILIELTEAVDDPLVVRAQRAIEGAAVYALAAVDEVRLDGGRDALTRLARIDRRIRNLWSEMPPSAPLPTLDPTPLM